VSYEYYTGYAPIHAAIGLENLRVWWSGVDEEAKTKADNWRAMTVGLRLAPSGCQEQCTLGASLKGED
jgi:hypothetical protein